MPRPQNKEALIETSEKAYHTLINYVDALSEEAQNEIFPEGALNRNLRDVFGHLHEWNTMTKLWYEVGMTGQKPNMPKEGYTWKTLPDLNRAIHKQYEKHSLSATRNLFEESFAALSALIHLHSEDELFEKKRYPWTGSTSMASYLISATSSHCTWALKLIKRAHKKGAGRR